MSYLNLDPNLVLISRQEDNIQNSVLKIIKIYFYQTIIKYKKDDYLGANNQKYVATSS